MTKKGVSNRMIKNSTYTVMNFDTEIARFRIYTDEFGFEHVTDVSLYNENVFNIIGCRSLEDWVDGRKPYVKRKQISYMLAQLGINNLCGYFNVTYGLTLTDALWIRPDSQRNLTWGRVNLYNNKFNKAVAHFAFDGSGVMSKTTSPEYSTDGALAKCWRRTNSGIYLYKRGSEGAYNCGREPYSEAYATQVLEAIKLYNNYVRYDTIMYHGKETSRCPIFTSEQIGFRTQARIFNPRTFEELFRHQMSSPYADDIRFMYVFDALILNEDRHLNNYGYLVDNRTGIVKGFAPIFDNGLSFLAYYPFNKEDVDSDDLNDIFMYADSRKMSCGTDFILVAKKCINNEIKRALRNLKGFRLKPVLGDSQYKADCLTKVMMRQWEKIMH